MNESELAANFEEAVWFDEQPHFELGFVGKHALSKLTRDSGLKTIISGKLVRGYALLRYGLTCI